MHSARASSTPTSGAPLAISATGLTKRFGALVAVDKLDLSVPAGTVFSLLGPNGSGKTTTVRMLATLLKPDGGSATVNGYNVVTHGAKVRATIALTGQFAALDPNLTAGENLRLMARLRGRSSGEAARVTDALMERLDAAEFKNRLVKQLSGGQKRRIDLAASLIEKPKLLVLDEPTTGLDPRSRQVVWTTIQELVTEGITLLLTTQYLEEADALADHIVLLDHGREIARGTPSELKSLVGKLRVDVVAVDQDGFERLQTSLQHGGFQLATLREQRRISIPAPDEFDDLQRVFAAVAGTGIPVDEIALRRPTLDDAFITLTGHEAQTPDPTGEQRAA
ncbi:MAG: ATP-binding cassette domain-containing protein [Solirubrobacteraceae bacterium]